MSKERFVGEVINKYQTRLSEESQEVLSSAAQIARELGHPYAHGGHIALPLLEIPVIAQFLGRGGLSAEVARRNIEGSVIKGRVPVTGEIRATQSFSRVLEIADLSTGASEIKPEDLFLGVILERGLSGIGVHEQPGRNWRALLWEISTFGTLQSDEVRVKAGRIDQIKARQAFDLEVRGLRNQELSISEIAVQLGVPIWKVKQSSQRLIAQGEDRRRGGRRSTLQPGVEDQIIALRNQNLKNREIMAQLDLTVGQYAPRLNRLLKEGEVAARHPGKKSIRGGARFAVQQVLDRHLAQNPGKPITLAEVAREVGVSGERVRQLYPQIAATRDVPPLFSRKLNVSQEEFDQQVKELLSKNLGPAEIARELHITKKLVLKAQTRIYRDSLKERELRIRDLRNQGLTDKRIAQAAGLTRGIVHHTLKSLYERGEAQKPRKQYRTREEAQLFKEQVANLRLDPRNFTTKQIAKITGEVELIITGYINRLIKEGRIPKRTGRKQ